MKHIWIATLLLFSLFGFNDHAPSESPVIGGVWRIEPVVRKSDSNVLPRNQTTRKYNRKQVYPFRVQYNGKSKTVHTHRHAVVWIDVDDKTPDPVSTIGFSGLSKRPHGRKVAGTEKWWTDYVGRVELNGIDVKLEAHRIFPDNCGFTFQFYRRHADGTKTALFAHPNTTFILNDPDSPRHQEEYNPDDRGEWSD